MDKIDLKALAREIKQTAAPQELETPETKKPETTRRENSPKNKSRGELKKFIISANKRNDFDLHHHIYIDTDIYEILRLIKTQTRLKLGNLASVLFEEFILEHKSEIITLLKKKSNRLI